MNPRINLPLAYGDEMKTLDIQTIVDLIKEQMPDGPPYGLL